jgi:type II secretory pathway component GspD/PulD (secretin)
MGKCLKVFLAGACCAVGGVGLGAEDPTFASPAVTNVAVFSVSVTNAVTFGVATTNLAPNMESPMASNAVALAQAIKALPTEAETNLIRRAALDAVANAVKAVRDTADKSAAAEKARRISTRTFKLNHVQAEDVAEKFNNTWSGDFGLTWKLGKIAQAFPEANVVMVTAPGAILDACEKVIADVDIEPMQVYIEARFVELGTTAMHKLGIDWSMFEGMKGTATMGAGINGYNVGKGVEEYTRTIVDANGTTSYKLAGGTTTGTTKAFKGDSDGSISHFSGTLDFSEMYVVLSALERENDTRIFSNPRIIVASGRKAVVDMTTKYPNVAVAAKRTSNSNSDSIDLDMKMIAIPGEDKFMFAKEAFFSWGIQLEVTPRVGTNGLINVSIVPTISSQTDWVTAGASDTSSKKADNIGSYSAKYPVIDVQRLVTDFAMADGTTAVIGGLSRTTEEQMDSGIPYLRDIPWIGNKLFGGKTRQKVQKEILVFVTVGYANPNALKNDVGLPKNAVLGKEYTSGFRKEPGDRKSGVAGVTSLDLRPIDEQAADPAWTNRTQETEFRFPLPFTKKR